MQNVFCSVKAEYLDVMQTHTLYNTTLDVISFATIFDFLYVRSLWELKPCALIQWPTG